MRELRGDLRREMVSKSGDGRSSLNTGLLLLGLISCLSVAGCRNKEETKAALPAAKSVVTVKVSSESITVSTASAEFRLSPSGALTAARVATEGPTSLESKSPDFSQVVLSAKKEHEGVLLDLVQAQVRDTTGKLGALGKHVEIAGTIPETTLTETLDLEIYDDFPNLALFLLAFATMASPIFRWIGSRCSGISLLLRSIPSLARVHCGRFKGPA